MNQGAHAGPDGQRERDVGADRQTLPVSVIICSRNRPALLIDTVQSVLEGNCWPAEIIVVDQSDAPNSDLAARPSPPGSRIRYIHTPRPGVSAARNRGARLASQELLVFLDDDLSVDRDWLGACTGELVRGGPRSVITGQVQEAPQSSGLFAPSCIDSPERVEYLGIQKRDILSSGNMGLHRASLEAVGGFDERLGPGTRLPAAEDNDLGFRLLQAGLRIVYVPEALVWHRGWRSEGDVMRLQWRYGLGQGAFEGKHLRAAPRLILGRLARDLMRPARSFPERLRSRRLRRLLGDFAFSGGVLVGLIGWLFVR